MLLALRLLIVLLLFGSTGWFGYATYRDYSMLMMDAVETDEPESKKKAAAETRAQKAVTGQDDTEEESGLSIPGALDEEEELLRGIRQNRNVNRHYVRVIGNGIAFAVLFVITGFGFAHHAGDFLRFDLGQKIDTVEEVSDDRELFEKAEYMVLKGKHLDAIELLRRVLELDPNHFEAQLRIAEIYDKNLENYQVAIGEYEAAIKHEFDPERWSWAAVRLCNLYSGKMGDTNRAIRLMRELADKHPHSGGAAKVQKRLAMIDAHLASRKG